VARRFLAGVGLVVGFAWLFRRLRKPQPVLAADPAVELKQRLAESRAAEHDRPGKEPEPEPEPAAPLSERRRAVHERARASIDEMRGRGTPPEP
jgi:hypothetical protein